MGWDVVGNLKGPPGSGGGDAPGTTRWFHSDPGPGWLKCDNKEYARASYPALSAALPPTFLTAGFDGDYETYLTGSATVNRVLPLGDTALYAVMCMGKKYLKIAWLDETVLQDIAIPTDGVYNTSAISMHYSKSEEVAYFATVALPTSSGGNAIGLVKFDLGTQAFTTSIASIQPDAGNLSVACFLDDGAYLAVALPTGKPTSDCCIWIYENNDGVLENPVAVTGMPTSSSIKSLNLSPQGDVLAVSWASYSSAGGRFFAHSGGVLTPLTDYSLTSRNNSGGVAFIADDIFVDSAFSLQTRIVKDGYVYAADIGGRLNDSAASVAAFPNVKRGIRKTPFSNCVFTQDTTTGCALYQLTDIGWYAIFTRPYHAAGFADFTADGKILFLRGSTESQVLIKQCDSSILRVPFKLGHWIKT